MRTTRTSVPTWAVTTMLLAGCTNLNQLAKDEQTIPLTLSNPRTNVKEIGALYLWPPSSSAAVVDKEGKHCVLAASGVKTINANSESAIKLADALDKIGSLDASTKSSIVESFTKLTAADSRAAFADVSLFHLCILEQNGVFKNDQPEKRHEMMDLFKQVINAAKDVK